MQTVNVGVCKRALRLLSTIDLFHYLQSSILFEASPFTSPVASVNAASVSWHYITPAYG